MNIVGSKSAITARVPRLLRNLPPPYVRSFLRSESGVAAVEFSIILPILLLLWFGGVEVTGALSVDRRLNNLATSIGDLVSRSKELTYDEVGDIFDLAPGAMFPYSAAGISMRVTAVTMDDTGKATAAWSRSEGSRPAHAPNAAMDAFVPATLRIPNSQIIMSEVFYTYTPALGYVITGDLPLEDKMFFVPRLVPKVTLCETSAANSPCVS